MSYYLLDFTSKKNDFNFENNLVIGRKIKLDQDSSKYYIYYQSESSDTPKEIYWRLPNLRLIYNLANHKFNQVNIPIYPNWDMTDYFVDFVQTFEGNIQECFQNKNIKKEFVSLISKKNLLKFIKTNLNDKVKITSNLERDITLNDFKINGQIDMVIKISYIWCKGNKMGLSSQLYQIKYIAPPDQLDINFIDTEVKKQYIPPVPPMPNFLMNSINMTSNINQIQTNQTNSSIELPPQIGIRVVPSIKDLQKAIKGLKPTNKKESDEKG